MSVTEFPSAPTATVLLVEDDHRLAEMVTALLVEEGYRVEVAGAAKPGSTWA